METFRNSLLQKFYLLTALCLTSSVFLSSSSRSQDIVSEYKEPQVIEGSNLTIYADPDIMYGNRYDSRSTNQFGYFIGARAYYTKWKFTNRIDYSLSSSVHLDMSKYPDSDHDNFYSSSSFGLKGALSYYLIKDKLFIGGYNRFSAGFHNYQSSMFQNRFYPFIGYGKLTDAFIINETSNFESVLLKEKYISKPFDIKTRDLLNLLLDQRNSSVFGSLYKDDADIEFFTKLEKILLEKGIINKPLNARTTMKLYQTLTNSSFILFPLFKGFQFQAELGYITNNYDADTVRDPVTLSLNSVYGKPLGIHTSLLFYGHFVFPVNKNSNTDYYEPNMHSPVLLRAEYQLIRNYNEINPDFIYIKNGLFDYKANAGIKIFHYFNPFTGISGWFEGYIEKNKVSSLPLGYNIYTGGELLLNVLNKFRISSGVHIFKETGNGFMVHLRNSLTYYIF